MNLFDAHFHIIDPKYPLFENHGYMPNAFTIADYKQKVKGLGITGGAVVSGSFQGFDQSYLTAALSTLGPNFFGVANIPVNLSSRVLDQLDKANICAVRFNLKRGGSEGLKHMVALANRLYEDYSWHTEIYIDSADLPEIKTTLKQIPKFSIDHLGLSKAGLNALFYWADCGVKIKATGFGRLDFNPITAMKKIHAINPESLMFGTDLPSTRAKTKFSSSHLDLVKDAFSDADLKRIFYQNALDWYTK